MASKVPASFRRVIVKQVTSKFREAVKIETVPTPTLKPHEILIKNRYLGINASDINYTAGRYDPGTKPPFPCGFEGVGEVVAAGAESKIKPGQAVAYQQNGAFGDYMVLPSKYAFPVPDVKPDYVTLTLSALTASVGLAKCGEMKAGEKVLVTAAAGGTGQFAVQLAKLAGCHVIGTCSSESKCEFLKSLGCDRPINYKKENLKDVLRSEYPGGVDVVYESVGADIFDICVNALGQGGRLIVIGFIAGYETDMGYIEPNNFGLPGKLLKKSASIRGFFLPHFLQEYPKHFSNLVKLIQQGKLKAHVDDGAAHNTGPFKGLEGITDAVEYLYTGKNVGKIIVELPNVPSKL